MIETDYRTSQAQSITALQPLLDLIVRATHTSHAALLYSHETHHSALCASPAGFAASIASSPTVLEQMCLKARSAYLNTTMVEVSALKASLQNCNWPIAPDSKLLLLRAYQFDEEHYILLLAGDPASIEKAAVSESLTAGQILLQQLLRDMLERESHLRREHDLDFQNLLLKNLKSSATFQELGTSIYYVFKHYFPLTEFNIIELNENQQPTLHTYAVKNGDDGGNLLSHPCWSPEVWDRYMSQCIRRDRILVVKWSNDSQVNPGSAPELSQAEIQTQVFIPLRGNHPTPCGVLWLKFHPGAKLSKSDLLLLEKSALPLGRHLEHQQNHHHLITCETLVRQAVEMANEVNAMPRLDSVLQHAAQSIGSFISTFDLGFILLRTHQKSHDSVMKLACAIQHQGENDTQIHILDETLGLPDDRLKNAASPPHQAEIIRSPKAIVDSLKSLGLEGFLHRFSPRPLDFNSAMIIPMPGTSPHVGHICLFSESPSAFGDREIAIMQNYSVFLNQTIRLACQDSRHELSPLSNIDSKLDVAKPETQFQQSYSNLEKSATNLLGIIDRIEEGVILFDSSQNIIFINQQVLKLFLLDAETETDLIIGKPILQWLHHQVKNAKPLSHGIEAVMRNHAPVGPIYLQTRQNTNRSISLHLDAVQSSVDREMIFLAVLLDMSHDEEINQLKNEFMSVISHEMRTPLTSIQGFARLLLEDLSLPVHQLKEFVEIISGEADRLSDMIQRILDVKRMESGITVINRQPVNILTILDATLQRYKSRATEEDRVFNTNINITDTVILGDPHRLPQLTDVILDNAFKFTGINGEVVLTLNFTDDALILEVKDNGCGIAPEDMPYIFDKFYRGRHSSNRRATGLGLGLTLAREIVELHHGTIDVESHLGNGAVFRIRLPQSQDNPNA